VYQQAHAGAPAHRESRVAAWRGRNPSTSYQGCDRVGTHVPNSGDARRKVGTQVRNSETLVRNSRDAGPEQWGRRCGTVGTQVRNSGDIHAEQWGRRCGTVGTLVRNSEDAGPEQWGRWSGTVGTLVRNSGDADAERWERWCGTVGRWSGTVGRWSGRVGMLVRKGGNAGAEVWECWCRSVGMLVRKCGNAGAEGWECWCGRVGMLVRKRGTRPRIQDSPLEGKSAQARLSMAPHLDAHSRQPITDTPRDHRPAALGLLVSFGEGTRREWRSGA